MTPSSVLIVGAGLAGARCAETFAPKATTAGSCSSAMSFCRRTNGPRFRRSTSRERSRRKTCCCAHPRRGPSGRSTSGSDSGSSTSTRSSGARRLRAGKKSAGTSSSSRQAPGRGCCRFRCRTGSTPCGRSSTRRMLRAALVPGAHLVVVGGGFVGAEVASTAIALGVRVTMLEALATPFERTLGPVLGRLLADRYRSHGSTSGCTPARPASAPARTGPCVRCCSPTEARSAAMSRSWVSEWSPQASSCRSGARRPCLRVRRRHRRARSLDERRHEAAAVARQILGLPPQTEQPASSGPTSSAFGSSSWVTRLRRRWSSSKVARKTSSLGTG